MADSGTQTLDALQMPLHGRHLVEASAGTGKTYTIVSLVLRLLLGHAAGATSRVPCRRIDEILVVTFTNAASEELLGRLRQRIEAACSAFAQQGSTEPLLRQLLADSDDHQRDLDRLRLAMESLDQAAVFTIHGFAQRMLRRFAFECGSSSTAVIEEQGQQLLQTAVFDYWRKRVYSLPAALADRVLADYESPQTLSRLLVTLLSKHELKFDNVPDSSWEALAQAVDTRRCTAMPDPGSLQGDLQGVTLLKKHQQAVQAFIDNWSQQAVDWRVVAAVSAMADDDRSYDKRRKERLPADWPVFRQAQALDQLGRQLTARFLVDAWTEVRATLPAIRMRRDTLAYDDLLQQLDLALHGDGGAALAAAIRVRFPVAMIDEFQDTDRLQWRCFSRIYDDAGSCLLLIGDPKQAIYRFRGADINAYILARRATPSRFLLSTNFRSTSGLVSAVNGLFALRADANPFLGGDDIPFHAANPSGLTDRSPLLRAGQAVNGLHALVAPIPLKRGELLPELAAGAARHIASVLDDAACGRATLGDRPLRAGDLAILVRDRMEALALRRALSRLGVPCVHQSRDSVFQSDVAQQLFQLFQALLHPGEVTLIRTALATGLMQRRLSELQQVHDDEAQLLQIQQRFMRYGEYLSRYGVMPAFRRLLHELDVPARLLAREDGDRQLTDAGHVLELLQLAQRGQGSADALLNYFRQCLAAPDGDQDVQQLRLESDADRVQIVTLHKSKGLQYPLVYLPFVVRYRAERLACFTDPDSLQPCYDLSASPAAMMLAEQDRLAEDLRLLYVGLTRAEHACVIGLADVMPRGTPPSEIGASAIGYLLNQDNGGRLEAALQDPAVAALWQWSGWPSARDPLRPGDEATAPLQARQFRGMISRDWQVSSYSAMLRQTTVSAEIFRQPELATESSVPSVTDAGRLDLFSFPRGARPGSMLHGLFESVDFNTDPRLPETAELISIHLAREGYGAEWLPVLQQMLEDVLACDLDGAGLRLGALPAAARRVELGFDLAAGRVEAEALNGLLQSSPRVRSEAPALSFRAWQGLLSGFIDLVFCHGGRYYVLDYKSNHLGDHRDDYLPERLDAAMAEHRYDLQYLLYLVALQRMLRHRLGSAYRYEQHVGGAWYLFLRGIRRDAGSATGVYFDRPPAELIDRLDGLLGCREGQGG